MAKEEFDSRMTHINFGDVDLPVSASRSVEHARKLVEHTPKQSAAFRIVCAAAAETVGWWGMGTQTSRKSPAGKREIRSRIRAIQNVLSPGSPEDLIEQHIILKALDALEFWKTTGRLNKLHGNSQIFPGRRELQSSEVALLEDAATELIAFPPTVGAAYMIHKGTSDVAPRLDRTIHEHTPGVLFDNTLFPGWEAVSMPTSLEPIILPAIPEMLQKTVASLHKIHIGLRPLLEKVLNIQLDETKLSTLFPVRFDMVLDSEGKFWVVDANPMAMGLSVHASRAGFMANHLAKVGHDTIVAVNSQAIINSLPHDFQTNPCILLDRGPAWQQPSKSRFLFRHFEVQQLREAGLDIRFVDMAEIQQGHITVVPEGIRLANGEIVKHCILGKNWRTIQDQSVQTFAREAELNPSLRILNNLEVASLFGNRLWLILLQFKEVQEHLINSQVLSAEDLQKVIDHLPRSAMLKHIKKSGASFAGEFVTGIDLERGKLITKPIVIPTDHTLSHTLIGIGGKGLVAKTIDGSGASGVLALSRKGHNISQLNEFVGKDLIFEQLVPSATFQVKQPFHPFPIKQGPGRFEVFVTFPGTDGADMHSEVVSLGIVVQTEKKEVIVHPAGAETTFIPIIIESS
jgi:hypothetical protein